MNKHKIRQAIEIIIASSLAIFLAVAIRLLFFQTFVVTNNSMEPTFVEGDKILVIKYPRLSKNIHKSDVIIFKDDIEGVNIIKRVVGIGNDKIEIKNNALHINDKMIENTLGLFTEEDDLLCTVESDSFFVLGDNIKESRDSRYFGTIKTNNVTGKVFLIFNPRSNIQFF